MIKLENISKTYKVPVREKGVLNAFKSVFKRKYKIIEALKNVSFEVNDGEIVGYIGPNGAGKSTTIKIMTGILQPSSGTIEINGYIPHRERVKYVKNIGAVFGQRSNLAWDIPVVDSYELLKDIYKIDKENYEKTLKLLVEKLDLADVINMPLRQLSLGQRMRCEIAGALLHSPKILFLDEPTIGLDSISKLKVRDFIKEINKQTGVTVILTTHDTSDIEALANRIILIGKGEKLYDGSFENIKKKYGNRYIIKVKFGREYDKGELKFDGYEVLSNDGMEATIKNLPQTEFNFAEFVKKNENRYDIKDVDVQGVSLEEIIAAMYEEYKL